MSITLIVLYCKATQSWVLTPSKVGFYFIDPHNCIEGNSIACSEAPWYMIFAIVTEDARRVTRSGEGQCCQLIAPIAHLASPFINPREEIDQILYPFPKLDRKFSPLLKM